LFTDWIGFIFPAFHIPGKVYKNRKNKMSCFIYFEIRPLPLPSPKERVIEPRVDYFYFKSNMTLFIPQYLFRDFHL